MEILTMYVCNPMAASTLLYSHSNATTASHYRFSSPFITSRLLSPNPLPGSPSLFFLFSFSPPPSSSLTAALSLPSPLPSSSIFVALTSSVDGTIVAASAVAILHHRPTTSQISSSPPLSSIEATSLPSFLHRRCSAQHFLCPKPSTSSIVVAASLSSAVAHNYSHHGVSWLPFLADRCHRPR